MPLDERELSYLWDMREAAREIVSFMNGVNPAKFEKNKVLRFGLDGGLGSHSGSYSADSGSSTKSQVVLQ